MKTMMTMCLTLLSLSAIAAPPMAPGAGAGDMRGPGPSGGHAPFGKDWAERRSQRAHLAYVLGISEALELSETEALKLSEKLRAFEVKRRPLMEQMGESMRLLKEAAGGDSAALSQIDASMQRILEGRSQLAALDKELWTTLSSGLTPQKKAKLALVLGKLHHRMHGPKDRDGRSFKVRRAPEFDRRFERSYP